MPLTFGLRLSRERSYLRVSTSSRSITDYAPGAHLSSRPGRTATAAAIAEAGSSVPHQSALKKEKKKGPRSRRQKSGEPPRASHTQASCPNPRDTRSHSDASPPLLAAPPCRSGQQTRRGRVTQTEQQRSRRFQKAKQPPQLMSPHASRAQARLRRPRERPHNAQVAPGAECDNPAGGTPRHNAYLASGRAIR